MSNPYFVCTKCGHCYKGEPHNVIKETLPPAAAMIDIYVCDECIDKVFDDLNAMAMRGEPDIAIPRQEVVIPMRGGNGAHDNILRH